MSSSGDFVLQATMALSAVETLETLKKVTESTKKSGGALADMTSKSQIALMKMSNAFSVMGNIAGGAFDKMVSASPSLIVSLAMIDLEMDKIYRTLGEALAPVIDEVILPLIEQLVDWFMDLSPEIQTTIGVIIGLMVAGGLLAPVLVTLATLVGLISWPVLVVIAAIALLYLAWKYNFGGIQEITAALVEKLQAMWETFASNNKGTFKELMDGVKELWAVIKPVVDLIVEIFWVRLAGTIESVVKFIMGIFDALLDFVSGIVTFFIGLFTWDMDMMGEGLAKMFKGLVNALVSALNWLIIDPINLVIEMLNTIPGIDIEWRLAEIPKLHSGGYIAGDGEVPIIAEGGEYMLSRSNVSSLGGPGGVQSMLSGGRGGGNVYHNTFNLYPKSGGPFDMKQLAREISKIQERQTQRRSKF